MSENIQNLDLENELLGAFMSGTVNEEIVVKAEDLETGSGIDYDAIFLSPQPGHSYTLKLVQNGNQKSFVHRSLYKKLPDPDRKGKSFRYVSNGTSSCPVLSLFFRLNELKKGGDAVAEKKISEYLGNTNQAVTLVEVITSNDPKATPGMFRLFEMSTYGPNATLASLINEKTNPSKEKLEQGFEKEDVWNLFESPLLFVDCVESSLPDGSKGRDYAKSAWTPKKMGVSVPMDDGTMFTFKPEHKTATGLAPEAIPAFKKLIQILQDPNLSIHNNFAYKTIDDPKNTSETNEYLKKVQDKLDRILPIIENAKSINEIQAACKVDNSAPATSTSIESKPENILASSIPAELQNSMFETPKTKVEETLVKEETTVQTDASTSAASSEAMDLMAQMGQ